MMRVIRLGGFIVYVGWIWFAALGGFVAFAFYVVLNDRANCFCAIN